MPQKVALICTIQRIDGYADTATNSELYAINISTALMTSDTMALNGVEDLLRPWNWTPVGGPTFKLTVWLQIDPKDITKGNGITVTSITPPPLADAAKETLTASLTAQLEGAAALSNDLITFDNANPGNLPTSSNTAMQPWPHLLGHASTFPAPVPQALNLVLFFRIPTVAANIQMVYAAPQFSANGVTCDATGTNPAPAPPAAGSVNIAPVSTWAYPNIDPKLPQVTVFQPGFSPQTAAQSAWITGTPEDSSNQDWRANLDQTLPDTFDLAQRSIDALRALTADQIKAIFNFAADEPQPTGAIRQALEDLRQAILSVLRDTADFGLRFAPDGVGLLQFVLRSLGQTDTLIQPILSALSTADKNYGFNTWQTSLQVLFPGLLGLQPVANTQKAASSWPDAQANLNNLIAQLDALQTRLADDATLAQCLFANWNATLSSLQPPLPAWNTLSSAVQSQLGTLSSSHILRKRMLQANIGGAYTNNLESIIPSIAIWKQITAITSGNGADTGQLQTNLETLLPAFFASRFNQQPAPAVTIDNSTRTPSIAATQTGFPQWQALLATMNANITAEAKDFAASLFPSTPKPTTVPQPIIVKFLETGQVPDQNDPLRSISGIGVLLLEKGAADWSALNIASLYVNTNQASAVGTPPNWVLAASNIFAPYRISLRNGILQTAISYDSNPLIAQSPLTPMSKEVASGLSGTQVTKANPLLQFRYEPNLANFLDPTKVDSWAHIYGLKFGRTYQFLAFALTNSGALPPQLTDGISTWNLQPPVSFKADNLTLASSTYSRRVPISHPRLPFTAAADKGTLPTFPSTVVPLARSLANSNPALAADTNGKALPLLLLWATPQNKQNPTASATYAFPVRPPQINLETWERWVAIYTDPLPPPVPAPGPTPIPAPAPVLSMRNTRAALRSDFVTSAKKSVADGVPFDQQILASFASLDTSINDPAVSYLEFVLTPISTNATKIQPADFDQLIPVPAPQAIASTFTYLDGFAQVQSGAYIVTIGIGTAIDMKIDTTARTVNITVLEGDLWRLSVTPIVTQDSYALFEKFIGGDNQFSQLVSVTDPTSNKPISVYRTQAASRDLLIEVAAPIVDTKPQLIWRSLKLPFDAPNRMLTATLDPSSLARPDLFYKADITRQVWRWMGRPFPGGTFPDGTPFDLPFPKALAAATDLNIEPIIENALYWEAQAFAERSLTDTHTTSSNLNYQLVSLSTVATDGTVTTKTTSPSAQAVLSKYDLSKDPRAHYYLLSLTLHSRYEDLPSFYPSQRVISNLPIGKASTPWNRVFLPAAATSKAPPKPSILLCLPLTEPLDPTPPTNGQPAPDIRTGFLVIADEPWPQIAGLAEQLLATIQWAPDLNEPLESLDPGNPLPEIGPDPILFSTPYSGPKNPGFADPGKPIGTTFDDLSSAPLFANTCFHFLLPDGLDLADWHMAKMTFIRSLRSDLTTPAIGNTLQSEPSDPVWVQFLPSSYHFRYQNVGAAAPAPAPLNISQLSFQPAATNGIQFYFDGKPVTILSGPVGVQTPPPQLEIWAMLMQQITDAAGKPGETYRGLFCAAQGGSFQPMAGTKIGKETVYTPSPNDVLYLIEVQKDTRNIDALADPGGIPATLFAPTNPDAEVTHRIVRLSPRIANT
jgi:hypothetical protein